MPCARHVKKVKSTIISMVSKYTPLAAKKVPKQISPIMMPKMSLCCQNVPSGGKFIHNSK